MTMSIYSYFCCTDCKVSLWLGKAVFADEQKTKVSRFQIGPVGSIPNHENRLLTAALWKMLAVHHGHTIHTFFDFEYDALLDRGAYREIGGDVGGDISIEEYVAGAQ
jgi:hypothetical protein